LACSSTANSASISATASRAISASVFFASTNFRLAWDQQPARDGVTRHHPVVATVSVSQQDLGVVFQKSLRLFSTASCAPAPALPEMALECFPAAAFSTQKSRVCTIHVRDKTRPHSVLYVLYALAPGSAFATSSMSALYVASCRNTATLRSLSQDGVRLTLTRCPPDAPRQQSLQRRHQSQSPADASFS
jgi:hypothetical protein